MKTTANVMLSAVLWMLSQGTAQAQVAYTFWHLSISESTATLVSHFDYEAPAGMLEAFTCSRGSGEIRVAQFTRGAEGKPDMKSVVRTAIFENGCDSQCSELNNEVYRGEQRLMIKRLAPSGAYVSTISWRHAKPMIQRRMRDAQQFGDASPQEVKEGIRKNLSKLAKFRSQCQIPSDQ